MPSQDELSALLVKIQVSIDAAVKNINVVKKEMESLAGVSGKTTETIEKNQKEQTSSTQKWMSKNSYALRTAGRSLVIYGGIVTAVLGKSMAELLKYQMALADVSTMVQAQGGQFTSLMGQFDQTIRTLSVTYNQNTEDLAKGLYNILSATFESAEALEILKWSAISAVGGITETGIAADALTTVLNSYSLGAESAGDVSNWLWGIVRRGKITYEQLARSIGKVSAIAANAGLSMNELGAALMTATRAGVRHRIATTSMNSVIMAFLKPQEKSIRLAKEFGITLDVNTLKTEGLVGVVKKLTGANRYNNVATAAQIAQIFNNRRALRIIMPIINQYAGFLTDVAYLTDRHGFALSAFNKVASTTEFKIESLGKSLKLLRMEAVAPFEAMLAHFVDWLLDVVKAIRDIPDWVKTATVAFVAFTAALSLLIGTLLLLAPGLIMIGTLLGGPVLGTIALVVAGIIGAGGLVAAFTSLAIAQDNSIKKMMEWTSKINKIKSDHKDLIFNLEGLITKYEDLLTAVNETESGTKARAEAEGKLSEVVQSIAQQVPLAVTAWDKYGKALRADMPIVKEMIELQKELYVSTLKNEAQQLRAILTKAKARAAALKKEKEATLASQKETRKALVEEKAFLKKMSDGGAIGFAFGIDISTDDIELRIRELDAKILVLGDKMKGLSDETVAAGVATIQLAVLLKELSDSGAITEYQLEAIKNTFPLVAKALDDLTSGEIKTGVKAFDDMGGSLEDIKTKFGSFSNFMDNLESPTSGWNWKHDLLDLEVKLEQAQFSMKELWAQPALNKEQKIEFAKLKEEVKETADAIRALKKEGASSDATDFAALKTQFKKLMEFWSAETKATTQMTIDEMQKRVSAMEDGSQSQLAAQQVLNEFVAKSVEDRTKEIRKEIKDYIKLTGVGTTGAIKELKRRQSEHRKFGVAWMSYTRIIADYEINLAGEVGAAWSDMMSGIADGLQDIMSDLFSGESTSSQNVADQTAEIQKEIQEIRDSLADATESEIETGLKKIEALEKDITELSTSLEDMVDGFLESFSDGFSEILSDGLGIESFLTTTFGMISAFIITLGALGVEKVEEIIDGIITAISELPAFFAKLLEELPKIILMLAKKIPEMIRAIAVAIPLIIQSLIDNLPAILDAIIEMIPPIIEALVEAIPVIIMAILDAIPIIIQQILDALPEIIKVLMYGVIDIIVMVIGMLPDIIVAIVNMIPEIITAFIELIPEMITMLIEAVPEIIDRLIESIPAFIQAIVDNFPEMIAAFMLLFLQSPFGLIGKAIFDNVDFGQLFEGIGDILEGIQEAVKNIFSSVGEVFEDIYDSIVGFIENVWAVIGDIFDGVLAFFGDIIEGIGKFFEGVLKTISGIVDEVIESIEKFFDDVIDLIADFFEDILEQLWEFYEDIFDTIIAIIEEVIESVLGFFEGIINSIVEFFSSIFNKVTTLFLDILNGLVKLYLTLMKAMNDFIFAVIAAIGEFFAKVWESISSFFHKVWTAISSLFRRIWSAITSLFEKAWEAITGFFEDTFSEVGKFFTDVLKKLVNFFADAISAIWKAIKKAVKSGGGLFSTGTQYTGDGGINEPAGIVHKKEAVIPWSALKDGLPGIAKFMGYELPEMGNTGYNPLGDLSIPEVSMPDLSGFKMSIPNVRLPPVAALAPSGGDTISIENKFVIEGGMVDDPLYWQNLVRERVIPEIDNELERYGKRLGG